MKDLLLLASILDEHGLYKVASKLDKIAQIAGPQQTTFTFQPARTKSDYDQRYQNLINHYKELIQQGDRMGALSILNFDAKKYLTPNQQIVFKKQTDRILRENPVAKDMEYFNLTIDDYGADFGLPMARDKREFDMKWKPMVKKIYKDFGNTSFVNQELQKYYKDYVKNTYGY
jgi:hypothetical protein